MRVATCYRRRSENVRCHGETALKRVLVFGICPLKADCRPKRSAYVAKVAVHCRSFHPQLKKQTGQGMVAEEDSQGVSKAQHACKLAAAATTGQALQRPTILHQKIAACNSAEMRVTVTILPWVLNRRDLGLSDQHRNKEAFSAVPAMAQRQGKKCQLLDAQNMTQRCPSCDCAVLT